MRRSKVKKQKSTIVEYILAYGCLIAYWWLLFESLTQWFLGF